jgi:hypothetical protein
MNNLDQIKKEIEKFMKKSPLSNDFDHSKHTLECLLRIKPDADEALQIAALAHDIERGMVKWADISKKDLEITSKEYLRPHEEGGAEIVGKILKKYNSDNDFIEKVKHLVARHEEGGDDEQNLIKDADSLSFFERFIPNFLARALIFGKKVSKKKLDWMYNRITSDKVKEMAKKNYDQAIKDLEAL